MIVERTEQIDAILAPFLWSTATHACRQVSPLPVKPFQGGRCEWGSRHLTRLPRFHGLTLQQILFLIFHPNFSTAAQVTELAGRGMGLAAVAAAVRDLDGRFQVSSRKNVGFQLQIVMPPARNRSLNRVAG